MRYSIHQIDATTWQLRASDGTVVATFEDSPGFTGYDLAVRALGGVLSELAAAEPAQADAGTADNGLLPEVWTSDQGIAFSNLLPGGRDFTQCTWSWRDPATCLVPLMFQTETEYGHMGAELAGFVESFSQSGGTVAAQGRFYNTEVGIAFRDALLGDRRFGVSVDPTEAVDVDEHFECTEWDDDGFCENGEWSVIFLAYEIGGVTGTPFPGFEEASIILSTEQSAASRQPVRAALSIPTAPPREWLMLAEPRPGRQFLGDLDGDDVLVDQVGADGEVLGSAVPLTIRDDGLVYGHLTWWGQCHIGEPWGQGVCASASMSRNGYADFLTGHVICADGTDVPTGMLVVGCEHSSAFDAAGVRDHLAHAGMGWASVRVVDGEYGPWLSGVLRPDLSEAQVRVLRSLSLSGEWVGELAGILAVNAPGLPVQRALAASAFASIADAASFVIAAPTIRSSIRGGDVAKMIGGNLIRRCPECEQRRLARASVDGGGDLRQIKRLLTMVERRTRHLVMSEAAATRDRLTISAP